MNTPIAPAGVGGTVQIVTSFLRLVEDLLREPTERAAYLADPAGYLPARGFEDFDTADVELSMQLTADAFPPALAARLDPSAGLDSVVSVDIDELPGLWAEVDDAPSFEEMADADDPFLDDADDLDASAASTRVEETDELDVPEVDDGVADAAVPELDAGESGDESGADSDALTSQEPSFDVDAGFADEFTDPDVSPDPMDTDLSELDSLDGDDIPFD